MGLLHLLHDVRANGLTHEEVLAQDFVSWPRVFIDFVKGPATKWLVEHPVGVFNRLFCGLPETMQAHDRAEGPELEPAGQQFVELRVMDVAIGKATDIGSPPGNTREACV